MEFLSPFLLDPGRLRGKDECVQEEERWIKKWTAK